MFTSARNGDESAFVFLFLLLLWKEGLRSDQWTMDNLRHCENRGSARRFIKKKWPLPYCRDGPIDMNSTITYAVSTTLNSSVLLIAKGLRHTVFTRNTYSADPENPWLIFQDAQENQALARHIQESWDNMAIHPNGDRIEVNKIAAHVLYQKVDDNWEPVPLPEADGSNVVRFRVNDIEIWSHPPRDEPLMTALRENTQFRRAEGDIKRLGRALIDIRKNSKIPKKQEALRRKRDEIKGQFVKIYGFYEKLVPLPESYQWPTLQLGQRIGTGEDLQRYGATFAGVYGGYANQVHNKFAASNVEARPLPTQATVYYGLLPQEEFALSFEDMMHDDI